MITAVNWSSLASTKEAQFKDSCKTAVYSDITAPIEMRKALINCWRDLVSIMVRMPDLTKYISLGNWPQDRMLMRRDMIQHGTQVPWWHHCPLPATGMQVHVLWSVNLHVVPAALNLNLNEHSKRSHVFGTTANAIPLQTGCRWNWVKGEPCLTGNHCAALPLRSSCPANVEEAVPQKWPRFWDSTASISLRWTKSPFNAKRLTHHVLTALHLGRAAILNNTSNNKMRLAIQHQWRSKSWSQKAKS